MVVMLSVQNYQFERLKNAYDPKSCKDLKNKCLNLYTLHGVKIATYGNEMTFNIEINNHYEKSRPPKPHYPPTKIQKTTHIQLLCIYPLGITTIMQLSP
jgi:hypothetical protein